MIIKKFTTKDKGEIELGKFNVLIGPNNTGKSQSLRDIHDKMVNQNARTTIITDLEFAKPDTFNDLMLGLEISDDPNNINQSLIKGIQPNLSGGDQIGVNLQSLEQQFDQSENIRFIQGSIGRFRVSYLDAGSRLEVVKQKPSGSPEAVPQNLLQALLDDTTQKNEIALNKIFEDTFGKEIKLDYSGRQHVCLRVAKKFEEIPKHISKAYTVLNKYHKIDTEGDGYKSFAGVVLSTLISEGRIILLDEPEAFLHPAQARKLGAWLAQYSNKVPGQIVVATHNANFLSGILSSNQNVNIFRLNRDGDKTTYTLISPDSTKKLANSPILSSQRVLEAVFHNGVVVCESDADRSIYQSVANIIFDNQNLLFIHAYNKQTIWQVVELLKKANIPVIAVTDIDILNSKTEIERLIKALNETCPNDYLKRVEKICKAVEGMSENEQLKNLKSIVEELHLQLEKDEHTLSGAKAALNRISKEASKWSEIKKHGVKKMPVGTKNTAKTIIQKAKNFGLFIVPYGELESWMNLKTRRKNVWVVKALKKIQNKKCSAKLEGFIKEILIKMGEDTTSHRIAGSRQRRADIN